MKKIRDGLIRISLISSFLPLLIDYKLWIRVISGLIILV